MGQKLKISGWIALGVIAGAVAIETQHGLVGHFPQQRDLILGQRLALGGLGCGVRGHVRLKAKLGAARPIPLLPTAQKDGGFNALLDGVVNDSVVLVLHRLLLCWLLCQRGVQATQFSSGRFLVEQRGETVLFGRGRATPMVCTEG